MKLLYKKILGGFMIYIFFIIFVTIIGTELENKDISTAFTQSIKGVTGIIGLFSLLFGGMYLLTPKN